jgi:TolB-like protein/DNA-binding winged helix-turn-helix (wHTH) protein/Flp pilus assembly protein TadD
MSQITGRFYEFGPFRIDVLKRILIRDGRVVPTTSKVFDTLLLLVEHSGQILQKDELMTALWPDTIVEENNLTQHISMLRKALGERAGEHRYVVTVPGRGYSFVANVSEVREAGSDLIPQQRTRSSITIDVEEAQDEDSQPLKLEGRKYLHAAVGDSSGRRRVYAAGFALSLLVLGLAAAFSYRRAAQEPEGGIAAARSIAVLPFKSLNATPEGDYLGSGMTDTLIARLSNIRQISVRPTSAVMKYAVSDNSRSPDTLAAGRELGVDSVLEGTVQRAGDRVRLTVQLLSVSDGRPLWARSFDERLTDIFAVQDAISEQVAQAMLLSLNGEERKRLRKHDTVNIDAYEAYLRGRYFWNKRDEEGLTKSIQYFQQATGIDPAYALAYAGIADAYSVLVGYGFSASSPEESFLKAKVAALKALELDETLAEAHTSLALIKVYYDHDNLGAEREFRRAIELNPSYATAHHWYSEYLATVDRQAEAMAEIKRAQELDPLSLVINTTLGERLYYARQYDAAICQLLKTLEIDPDFSLARFALALAYEQKGGYAEAVQELARAKGRAGGGVQYAGALGHTYAVSGRQVEAREILNELLRTRPEASYEIATIYAGLGEKQRALEWLRKSPKKYLTGIMKADPRWDGLRSDPKFEDLFRV